MKRKQSIKLRDKIVVEIRGIENVDRAKLPNRTLQEAKDAGDAYFVDSIALNEGDVHVLASKERDAPERTYSIDCDELCVDLAKGGFVVEARVPLSDVR